MCVCVFYFGKCLFQKIQVYTCNSWKAKWLIHVMSLILSSSSFLFCAGIPKPCIQPQEAYTDIFVLGLGISYSKFNYRWIKFFMWIIVFFSKEKHHIYKQKLFLCIFVDLLGICIYYWGFFLNFWKKFISKLKTIKKIRKMSSNIKENFIFYFSGCMLYFKNFTGCSILRDSIRKKCSVV